MPSHWGYPVELLERRRLGVQLAPEAGDGDGFDVLS